MIFKRLFILGLMILLPITAVSSQTIDTLREQFLSAETALARHQFDQYERLKKPLVRYPLFPYLLHAEYKQRLPKVSHQELAHFLDRYADSPLAEELRIHWLQAKAKQEDWGAFLKAYQPTEDVSMQCYHVWASLQMNPNQKSILNEVTPLWMSGKQTPKSCEAVFQVFEKSDLMSRPMIWQRTKRLIQEGNESLARKMTKHLRPSEVALVELWLMIRHNPYLVTHSKYFKREHAANLEMIVDGVSLIAKTKPETAIKVWQQIARKYPFEERHWGLVVRAIGLAFALERNPEAEKWLGKVPSVHANKSVHELRIRLALGREDWPLVLKWVQLLPTELAGLEEWQYWQGRALEMSNQQEAGKIILNKLSKSRTYYGFLSSQQLAKPYTLLNQKIPVEKQSVKTMAHQLAVTRARELYLLGRTEKARAEWLFITKKMDDKEKHIAAHLAMDWELPNWAILALSKAHNKDGLSLRFPVVYGKHVLQEASKNQIDPALILAIARQESAFVPHAKSSAGALGLMQLIPSTAEMVARKKQIPFYQGALLKPHTNIQLGSGYLKMMLDKHQNNAVLAAAAYNAGPGRLQKWLPTFDMAADAWVETIPYKETREYVKNVMTYTAIYQEILGKRPHLGAHMPYIAGK